MRPHLFIATPCFGGMVTQGYMQSVLGLMSAAGTLDLDVTLALLGQDALITRCRNTLVAQFMQHLAATHLLFIDADIGFSPQDVARLVLADKPIVAALYPLKAYYWDAACTERLRAGEAIETAGLHYVGKPLEPTVQSGHLLQAEFAGTGFMLIERRTIERMIAAYPETRYTALDAYRTGGGDAPDSHALFDCFIEPQTGIYRSEDFTFCWRWRQLGGEIWLDGSARLIHTGASDFQGSPAGRLCRPA